MPGGTELNSHGPLKGQVIKQHEKLKPNTAGIGKASCLGSKGDRRQRMMTLSLLVEGILDSEQRNGQGKSARCYTPDSSPLFVAYDFTLV